MIILQAAPVCAVNFVIAMEKLHQNVKFNVQAATVMDWRGQNPAIVSVVFHVTVLYQTLGLNPALINVALFAIVNKPMEKNAMIFVVFQNAIAYNHMDNIAMTIAVYNVSVIKIMELNVGMIVALIVIVMEITVKNVMRRAVHHAFAIKIIQHHVWRNVQAAHALIHTTYQNSVGLHVFQNLKVQPKAKSLQWWILCGTHLYGMIIQGVLLI